jgi:YggT family protein
MFGQIATFLVDTVVTFIVFLLLARFLLQWLRVPFRNPVGEFLVATTNWIVVPARRLVPGVARTDWATLLLAWILQALGIWLQAAIVGAQPGALAIFAVALVDLVRFGVYILVFAVIVQVVFSWVNPDAPLAPVFDAITRPFLRPIRRYVPPIGSVDLSPAILFIILQILLFAIRYVAIAAAGL